MGFDHDVIKFLVVARSRGASFEKTATLGRHTIFSVTPRSLSRCLSDLGMPTPEATARELLERGEGWSEPLLQYLGASEICSIDGSSYENATLVHDLNQPIPDSLKNRFTVVIDSGTLEHVFNFPVAIKNAMEMLAPGGTFIGVSPINNFMGHGFYQFGPELYYRVFSEENGFAVDVMIVAENFWGSWYRVEDPARVNRRIRLANIYPTNMFVIARRLDSRVPLAKPPQQSDYVTVWGGKELEPAHTRLVDRILGAFYRDFRVYRIAYRLGMPLYALTSPWMRKPVYQRTSPRELARLAK